MIKRLLSALLIAFLMLNIYSCAKPADNTVESTPDTPEPLEPLPNNSNTDCEIIELASKTAFNKTTFDYGDEEIIVSSPKFTGIKIDEVYSYKAFYEFNNDGLLSVCYGKNEYYTLNTKGEIVDYTNTPVKDNKAREYSNLPWETKGRPVSEKTMIIQTGEQGNYKQQLHSYENEPLSDSFDSIGYFYNGLALVTNDNKIGIIDESGRTLLEPSVPFDKIKYPPEIREFDVQYMDQNAFLISIGGELAVINIYRNKKLFTLDEKVEKYNYSYNLSSNTPETKAYTEFVKTLTDVHGYALKDLNGDGTLELIVKTPSVAITVYGYNGQVFEIGSHEFYTGSLRLLCSKAYSGIVAFTVGGGANLYQYLTVKNGELVIEDIWKDYYSYDGVNVTTRFESLTNDNSLIKHSAIAYNNGQDLQFNTL